jgi:phosphatidylinositol 4-phosphatase
MGHDIYRATDFDILPLNTHVSVQHPTHPVEGHLLALVRSHLYGSSLLFSYTWDLTRRLQAQWDNRESDIAKAMWEVVSTMPRCSYFPSNRGCRQMIDFSGTSL